MANIRRAEDRGKSNMGWLDSAHTFSFAHYYHPQHMGYGTLRVINDDRVEAGAGFGSHPHQDMEIVSVVLEGAMEHRDSMGHGTVILPGDVQRMSAGTGIVHSEYNHHKDRSLRFLQIWILPDRSGHKPGYEQKHFSQAEKQGRLRLVGSGDGRDGSISYNQDLDMYSGLFQEGEQVQHTIAADRVGWLHVAGGTIHLNGQLLKDGDGAALEGGEEIRLHDGRDAEVLLFDMK